MMILKLHQRPGLRVKASISTAGVIKKTTIMVCTCSYWIGFRETTHTYLIGFFYLNSYFMLIAESFTLCKREKLGNTCSLWSIKHKAVQVSRELQCKSLSDWLETHRVATMISLPSCLHC